MNTTQFLALCEKKVAEYVLSHAEKPDYLGTWRVRCEEFVQNDTCKRALFRVSCEEDTLYECRYPAFSNNVYMLILKSVDSQKFEVE